LKKITGTSTRRSKAISTGGRGGGRGRQRGRSRRPSTAYRPMLHELDKLPSGFIFLGNDFHERVHDSNQSTNFHVVV